MLESLLALGHTLSGIIIPKIEPSSKVPLDNLFHGTKQSFIRSLVTGLPVLSDITTWIDANIPSLSEITSWIDTNIPSLSDITTWIDSNIPSLSDITSWINTNLPTLLFEAPQATIAKLVLTLIRIFNSDNWTVH